MAMASKATQEHFTGCVTSIDLAIDLAERVDSITPAANVKASQNAGTGSFWVFSLAGESG
jgi:hypothetical protein